MMTQYFFVVYAFLLCDDKGTVLAEAKWSNPSGDMSFSITPTADMEGYTRLTQLVAGKKTRKDHPQVMNAAVRLYADAANAKTKMENGFDLTDYDNRTLSFAKDYADKLLAIDVNLNTTEMLDVTWGLFAKYFKPEEVNIKKELVDEFWTK